MRQRLAELPRAALPIAQTAVAAGIAWLLAIELLGHANPFFAPVAAILTLGLAYGRRFRRAVEVGIGVALGVAIADLLVLALGTGTWQLVVVVALAMVAAVLAGGGALLVNQAAISAVLVVTLQPPSEGIAGDRVLDALIGSAVALAVNALVPTDPLRLVRRETVPLLEELAATLVDVAEALRTRDREAVGRAIGRARGLDPTVARFHEALGVARETTVLAPPRRRARGPLAAYEEAALGIDLAVRNTRVLARGAIRAVETGENVPPHAIEAIDCLAAAVRDLLPTLAGEDSEAEREAVHAAALATAALEETGNLSASVIVGQVRSTAVDLLLSMGADPEAARATVREATL